MPKTLYEHDMEDTLRQIADALGVAGSRGPDAEELIRAAKVAGKDAERYRRWRADYTDHANPLFSEMLLALADAWTADDVDAAIDAALAVGAA